MKYIEFYKAYGTRKLNQIESPRVFNLDELVLPMYSTLYLYNTDLDTQTPTKTGILKPQKSIDVRTISAFSTDTIGNYNVIGNMLLPYIRKCRDAEPGINFIISTNAVLKANTLLVKNFFGLNSFYKYKSSPLVAHWRSYNILSTIVNEINLETNRNIFIPLNVDVGLRYSDFKMLLGKRMNSGLLKKIPSYDTLITFELWRLLNPDTKKDSIFSKIKDDKLANVNLLLQTGNKTVVLNLKALLATVVDYKGMYNYKISAIPHMLLAKLLFVMFRKITLKADVETIDTNKLVDRHEDREDRIDEKNVDKDIESLDKDIREVDETEDENIDDELEEDIMGVDNIVPTEVTNNDVDKALNSDVKTLQDVSKQKDKEKELIKKVELLADSGAITKKKQEKVNTLLVEQKKIAININGKESNLGEVLTHVHNFKPTVDEAVLEPSKVNKDPIALKNTMIANTKKYIKEDHEIMVIKSLAAVQNNDFIVTDIDIKHDENILGKTTTYTLEATNVDGEKSKIVTILPKVDEDGTYTMGGNRSIMRNQRADIPIRKIDSNEVVLSSYYGKLFITRGTNKNNDLGYWIRTQLLKAYANDIIKDFITNTGKEKTFGEIMPSDYLVYGKYVKSFVYEDYKFIFDYHTRHNLVDDKILAKIEKDGVLIGTKNSMPIILRYDNIVYQYDNGRFKEIGPLEEILKLNMDKSPNEYINVRMFKTQVPLVLLLGYYYGLEKLLDLYNASYKYEKTNTKVDKSKYIEIKFAQDKLVIKKDVKYNALFNGLVNMPLITKKIDRLNDKNNFSILFNLMSFSLLVKNEIPFVDNMFVDPITLELLKILKMPETFRGLLVKAVELLIDDNYTNPKDIENTVFKGYERFSGMVYNQMVKSLREQKNKSTFAKSKLTMNPYIVIKKLTEDSTTMLVNDLNPIANLKQYEDVTYLGALFGRNKEAISKDVRSYDVNDIGIISEANKDSGDVGISAYLTASPSVVNTLGVVKKVDIEETSWASILSTSAMLAPFGVNDDMKRLIFSGIQNEHVIPTLNMSIPYVRSDYDTLIASRLGGNYAHIADDSGLVIAVSKTGISIRYGKEKTYVKKYKLYSWYSKIESNATFKHTIVTNVIKGERVKKGDVIAYDSAFFIPDLYDKTRVIYLQATMANLAFIDDIETYEDSTTLSYKMSELMSIDSVKIKSTVIKAKDNVLGVVRIGDSVIPTTPILTITDQTIDLDGLDEESIEVLKNMNSFSPKAKYEGIIDNIVVYYNCDFDDLSDTLKILVAESDERLVEKTGFTGRIDSSYSINGKPMLVGNIEVRIFIGTRDDMSNADKMIWGNQMKCTVGGLFKRITTYDTNEEVDATFSATSVNKRKANSMVKMGLLGICAKKIESDILDIYFNK